jgi:hypothetical protein
VAGLISCEIAGKTPTSVQMHNNRFRAAANPECDIRSRIPGPGETVVASLPPKSSVSLAKNGIASKQNAAGVYELVSATHKLEFTD